jgi:hypothetical protein
MWNAVILKCFKIYNPEKEKNKNEWFVVKLKISEFINCLYLFILKAVIVSFILGILFL